MAIGNVTITDGGLNGMGSGTGSETWALTLTTGKGCLIGLTFGAGSDIVINYVSLTTDTLMAAESVFKRGDDTQGCWYYVPNVTTASQTLTFNYTQTQNVGGVTAVIFQFDGHNTSDMIGAVAKQADALSFSSPLTAESANSAVFLQVQGGNYEPGAASGYGSWTVSDYGNASRRAWYAYNLDVGAAGAKSSIAWDTGDYAYAVEIKPLAGIVTLGGSALTGGAGTQIPSISVAL